MISENAMIPAVKIRNKNGKMRYSYVFFDKKAIGAAKKMAKIWKIGYNIDCEFEMVEENRRTVYQLV